MRQTTALILCALAALAFAAAAGADVTVGVADDRGKLAADGGVQFLADMRDVGLQEDRITLAWDPDRPTTILQKEALDRFVANATAAGIRISVVIAPSRARALFGSTTATSQFVRFVTDFARAYPQIKDIAVGNEPNQPRFWQPQFSSSGVGLACTAYERVLAQAYDALKAVDSSITVLGISLSPRGNDNALAATNASASAVPPERDRLAGLDPGVLDRRVLRSRVGHTARGGAVPGGPVLGADPVLRLRCVGALDALLRPRRRARPRALAGRPHPRRRDAATVLR